jgi:NAD dependent epimerase/dehydratase
MKILVTGSEGFIGSHLVERLIKLNHNVRAFVLYNSFNSWGWLESTNIKKSKNLEIFLGDIRDPVSVEKSLEGIDIVINLAALIGVPYSYYAASSYIDTNVKGILNILNVSKRKKIKQIIQISTSEVYGSPKKTPINENFALNAQSPYAASKIASDHLSLSFYRSFNTPVSIIRPFNTFGPRQSERAIIPTIITQALKGNSVELGSIFPKRDFLFVEDNVRGIIAAIGKKRSYGEVINLGTGFDIKMSELVKLISKIMGIKIKIRLNNKRVRPKKSEVDRLLASTIKAKKILNWEPKLKGKKGLEKGLIKTINWFKDEKNLQLYKSNKYII